MADELKSFAKVLRRISKLDDDIKRNVDLLNTFDTVGVETFDEVNTLALICKGFPEMKFKFKLALIGTDRNVLRYASRCGFTVVSGEGGEVSDLAVVGEGSGGAAAVTQGGAGSGSSSNLVQSTVLQALEQRWMEVHLRRLMELHLGDDVVAVPGRTNGSVALKSNQL